MFSHSVSVRHQQPGSSVVLQRRRISGEDGWMDWLFPDQF